MSFTLVGSGTTSNNGSGGSLGTALASGTVQAGDFVYAVASNFGTAGITSVSDGTSTFSTLTAITGSADEMRGFYLLASVATGTPTYTVTFSGTPASRSLDVYVFRPSGAVSLDQQNGQAVAGASTGDSLNVTTTGTDELSFGAQYNQNQSGSSNEKINGVVAAAVIDSGTHATLWYATEAATYVGKAICDIGSTTTVLCSIATFYIPAPVITSQPTTQTVWEGQTATFSVTATGTGTLHYQWKANGSNVGTDSSTYTTPVEIFANNGTTIQVVITDDNGSTNSDIVLLIVLIAGILMWIKA